MPLNKSSGNMYPWITHTWNPVKGIYKRYNLEQKPVRLDGREMKVNLGKGGYIFAGSSCDLFASDVNFSDVKRVLERCCAFDNRYFFQTKNPGGFYSYGFYGLFPPKSVFCITLETNRHMLRITSRAPSPEARAGALSNLDVKNKMITVEPVMDFDLEEFTMMIKSVSPIQVNVGADSGHNSLPEPPPEKIKELIGFLEENRIKVFLKDNLRRLFKAGHRGAA
jgi:hypothetical protein